MDNLVEVLVEQAFKSQKEQIDNLKQEVELLRKDNERKQEQIDDLKTLNSLFDEEFKRLKGLMYSLSGEEEVDQKEEPNIMEEYKFGTRDAQ